MSKCDDGSHRWKSQIMIDEKNEVMTHLGDFELQEDAACAFDMAAIKTRGWTAALNFQVADYSLDPDFLEILDRLTIEKFILLLQPRNNNNNNNSIKRGAVPAAAAAAAPPAPPPLGAPESPDNTAEAAPGPKPGGADADGGGGGGAKKELPEQSAANRHDGVVAQGLRTAAQVGGDESEYRGVWRHPEDKTKWVAHIWEDGQRLFLGAFDAEKDAARIFDKAAIKLRGWSTALNFEINDYSSDIGLCSILNRLTKQKFMDALKPNGTLGKKAGKVPPKKPPREASNNNNKPKVRRAVCKLVEKK